MVVCYLTVNGITHCGGMLPYSEWNQTYCGGMLPYSEHSHLVVVCYLGMLQ